MSEFILFSSIAPDQEFGHFFRVKMEPSFYQKKPMFDYRFGQRLFQDPLEGILPARNHACPKTCRGLLHRNVDDDFLRLDTKRCPFPGRAQSLENDFVRSRRQWYPNTKTGMSCVCPVTECVRDI